MLRTLVVVFALGAPGVAAAEQFPDSAVGVEVRSDDGTVVGRVEAVERDADGRIVAAEISDQEPASAPYAPAELVADNDDELIIPVREVREQSERATGGERAGLR